MTHKGPRLRTAGSVLGSFVMLVSGCGPGDGMEETIPHLIITEVVVTDMAIDQIEVQNIEGEEVVLDDWHLCSGPSNTYAIPSGTRIRDGEVIIVTFDTGVDTGMIFFSENMLGDIATAQGEMALFHSGEDFEERDNLSDYVQWGGAPGDGHEQLARRAGLWSSGDFIDMTGYMEAIHSLTRRDPESDVDSWIFDAPSIGIVN